MIVGDVFDYIDTFLEDIKDELNGRDTKLKYLELQNRALYDEHYKDNEMQQMLNELNKMKDDYYRGFPISEEENKNIKEWIDNHERDFHGCYTLKDQINRSGCCGGTYTYEFVPTSIGTIGTVRCSCGAKFTFQDMV